MGAASEHALPWLSSSSTVRAREGEAEHFPMQDTAPDSSGICLMQLRISFYVKGSAATKCHENSVLQNGRKKLPKRSEIEMKKKCHPILGWNTLQ